MFNDLNFEKALNRIKNDKRDDPIHDVVGFRDLIDNKEEIIRGIKNDLNDYQNFSYSFGQTIDIPKPGFTLRPAVLPVFRDRLVYQAIADHLQLFFEPEQNVYSNKANTANSNLMFERGVQLWLDYQNKTEEYCQEYPFIIETDITAYFDHIYHENLKARIRDLFSNSLSNEVTHGYNVLLGRFLKRCSGQHLYRFGIPQLNDPSSFFGNIYLDELDKWLINSGNPSLRYVDDIRIFAKSIPNARKILGDLIIYLRRMGLFVSSAKTSINESKEVLQNLVKRRDILNFVDDQLKSGNIEQINIAAGKICQIFNYMISDPNNFDDRLFRFCINRFSKFAATNICNEIHSVAIAQVLNHFEKMPNSTDIFVDYLSMFPDNEEIQSFVIDFLLGDSNIYPWQEMHLLELLIRSNINSKNFLKIIPFIKEKAINFNGTPSLRKAIVLWGKNGSYADKREIRSLFSQKNDKNDQRSILWAIQEMQIRERDNFYNSIRDIPEIGFTVGYIRKNPEPKYHYFTPPNSIQIFNDDFEDDSDDLRDMGSEYFL